jgi:hypothetical protein
MKFKEIGLEKYHISIEIKREIENSGLSFLPYYDIVVTHITKWSCLLVMVVTSVASMKGGLESTNPLLTM